MCIMFVKEEDQDFPTDEVIKLCWDDNRDGAGYSWYDADADEWVTVKGTMTYNAFKESFDYDRDHYDLDNKTVIVHFRVGTTGGITGAATHPFPADLNPNYTVKSHRFRSKGLLFHNGTVGVASNGYSDTQLATMEIVQPMAHHIFENDEVDLPLLAIMEDLLKAHACRYTLTWGSQIMLLGPWNEEGKYDKAHAWTRDPVTGLPFSNVRFKMERTNMHKELLQRKTAKANTTTTSMGTPQHSSHATLGHIVDLSESVRHLSAYIKDDGIFNWAAWDGRYTPKTITPVEPKTDNLIPVYDKDGKKLYSVKKENDDTGRKIVECVTCSLIMAESDLLEGECPSCGTILLIEDTVDGKENAHDYECPVCNHDFAILPRDITIRKEGVWDLCECTKCGCVWGYTDTGGDWILGYMAADKFVPADDQATWGTA